MVILIVCESNASVCWEKKRQKPLPTFGTLGLVQKIPRVHFDPPFRDMPINKRPFLETASDGPTLKKGLALRDRAQTL